MARGRKPTPTRLKLIKGNPGKRRLPEHEPRPDQVVPEKPDWLSGEAAAEWDRLVPELEALGLVAKLHRAVLVTYCRAWADYVELYHDVQETGVDRPYGRRRAQAQPERRELARRLRAA